MILLVWGCKVLVLAKSWAQFTSLMTGSYVARASTGKLEPVISPRMEAVVCSLKSGRRAPMDTCSSNPWKQIKTLGLAEHL